jgi:hypothetical protein
MCYITFPKEILCPVGYPLQVTSNSFFPQGWYKIRLFGGIVGVGYHHFHNNNNNNNPLQDVSYILDPVVGFTTFTV